MTSRLDHHRRGAALLIVLGVLVMCMTATTIVLTAASNAQARRELDHAEVMAFDMFDAAEAPIQHWLSNESGTVVLPPDATVPGVSVLHDEWSVDGEWSIHLDISAFDQLGMVPMQVARSGSPLRLAWPAEIATIVDQLDLPPLPDPTPLGLDLIQPARTLAGDPSRVVVFPPAMLEVETASIAPFSVGAAVATHNRDPIRINTNTAPRSVLESALRLGGRGDLQAILSARARGQSGSSRSVPMADAGPGTNGRAGMPRLVTSSDCWSFRIDITVGNLKRSWWAIYQPGPDDPGTPLKEHWRCVQRLAIDQ